MSRVRKVSCDPICTQSLGALRSARVPSSGSSIPQGHDLKQLVIGVYTYRQLTCSNKKAPLEAANLRKNQEIEAELSSGRHYVCAATRGSPRIDRFLCSPASFVILQLTRSSPLHGRDVSWNCHKRYDDSFMCCAMKHLLEHQMSRITKPDTFKSAGSQ